MGDKLIVYEGITRTEFDLTNWEYSLPALSPLMQLQLSSQLRGIPFLEVRNKKSPDKYFRFFGTFHYCVKPDEDSDSDGDNDVIEQAAVTKDARLFMDGQPDAKTFIETFIEAAKDAPSTETRKHEDP